MYRIAKQQQENGGAKTIARARFVSILTTIITHPT